MTARLDMSDVQELAATLGLSASRTEQALDKVLDGPADAIAAAQKAAVRRRSEETYNAISAIKPSNGVRLVGADNWNGARLERGTSRSGPFPWLEEGVPAAIKVVEVAAVREAAQRLFGGS